MNELKPIPTILTKTTVRAMFIQATDLQVKRVITQVQKHCRGALYNKRCKTIDYKEFRYIVALLWNPNGYIQVLTKDEEKELQKEIEI